MFGELSLFDPGPRTMTATAVAETQLLGLGHESLHAFLLRPARGRPSRCSRRSPSGCAAPTRHLADLVFTDVPGRVAKALLDLSDRFGRPAEDGILVAHDLTQEELAQLVGASRETVNKALADFADPRLAASSRPAPCCCWTSSGSSAAPADRSRPYDAPWPRRSGVGAQVAPAGPAR